MIKIIVLVVISACISFSQSNKVLRVGTSLYPPFEFYKNHELVGYDIDFGNELGRQLGLQITWIVFPFQELFPALESRKVDILIAAIHITEERKQKYLFSAPYLNTGLVFVTNRNHTKIRDISNLEGLSVAAKEGATGYFYLLEIKERLNLKVFTCRDTRDCYEMLLSNKVRAVCSDYLSARDFIKNHSELEIPLTPFKNTGLGVVSRQENAQLIKKIDLVIREMNLNKFLRNLYIKWIM